MSCDGSMSPHERSDSWSYGLSASKEVEWTAWLMVFRACSRFDLEETAVVM